ncbi:MAG: deoxyguanosinetriphosphate triphosphohydrolase [Hyphomicrobiaceae bacterium]
MHDRSHGPDGIFGPYGSDLAPGERSPGAYAASRMTLRGRQHPENECPTRSPFQRDRDRILHSTAFRRLIYKTQVFLFHEGDHYRTRLTHSLEAAQIARTLARQLRLDEDLAEALALAHDLGHPPFGHAGERALDAAMRPWGGFDHNAQSLRVVTRLERKYAAFDGLNLTWEMLEGLAKHNGPIRDDDSQPVRKAARAVETWQPLDLGRWASGEAQAAAIADDIAYCTHDLDDALRAGLIDRGGLHEAPLAGSIARGIDTGEDGRYAYEVRRRSIMLIVSDVVGESHRRLAALAPASADDIRAAGSAVVAFSPHLGREIERLKEYLFARVYRHERVLGVMTQAQNIVHDLFRRYLDDDTALPPAWQTAARALPERRRARLIADFVAGMTDRYALAEHRRLFDATADLHYANH